MKVFRLDPTTFRPSTTIQLNFDDNDTLVWAERYATPGDFTIVVYDDISPIVTFPVGSLISHSDTKEAMIVENHEIIRDKAKKLKITVTGRSVETFTENRVTQGSRDPLYVHDTGEAFVETTAILTAEDAIVHLLENSIVDGIASPTEDGIPGIIIDTAVREPDAAMAHVIKHGDIYARVIELLGLNNLGIKTIRPSGVDNDFHIRIHDGVDNTAAVIFYALYEDLDDAKYFWSIKNYKNYAQVAAHIYARLYKTRLLFTELSGFERRVMYVEANDIEVDPATDEADDVVASRAQAGLDAHHMISLLSATISKTARPKFKIHYDVGDLVTVYGEFGVAEEMRVTEHILTVDKNGQQGYPSLTAT